MGSIPLQKDSLFEKYNDGLSLRTILGDFDGELLKDVDVVVVSPGVSVESYGLACLLQSVSISIYFIRLCFS